MNTLLNALGFVALVAVYISFRGMMGRRRRRAIERFQQSWAAAPPPLPQAWQCPRCAMALQRGVGFCPRCGARVQQASQPLPRMQSQRQAGWVYVVLGILGAIGVLAYWFTAKPAARPVPDPMRFSRPPLRAPSGF